MTTKNKAPKEKKPKAPAKPKAPKVKAKVESRHISELTKVDREALEGILRKEPSAVDEVELAVLSARAAYLTTDEREKYGV